MLAVVLTAIPFGLVDSEHSAAVRDAGGHRRRRGRCRSWCICAIFLHLNFTTTPRENLLGASPSLHVLIFIMVGGSLWIMFDLNARMMS